jgi:hypothetical protein
MILIAVLMLSQAAAASAGPAPAPAQLPVANVECRMIMEPGSRIPTKVCRLDKEWELLARDAQDDIQGSRNSHGAGMNSGDPR